MDRKARNHCQDVDNMGMKTTVRLETAVMIESTVRMEMSMQIDYHKTSGLP